MIQLILAHLVKQDHAIYHPPLPKGVKPPDYSQMQASRETRAESSSCASRPALSYGESACNQVLVLWKSPEEWGNALYEWSIMTLHEILTSTFVERSNMPPLLLRIALQTQVRKDRAQIFSVTTDRWSSLRGAGDLLAQATDESMLDLGVKFV
ncbi:hypothetical protein MYAM1_002844 [Malassezia yamatoensis]|uniref:Uncharacterized protein n=1 Tax=Malassezia yamatoensis TaxID=253288 RepID=A0AAJ5YUP3_9BASI|nr:hypothetical protein MYAM1_002844 [Malassezia yamatoensis]